VTAALAMTTQDSNRIDPHPARSRLARQRRRFPGWCGWPGALATGPGCRTEMAARLPAGANPVGARASMPATSSPSVTEPPQGRAWRMPPGSGNAARPTPVRLV
jgi:hypothetical protein